MAKSFGPYSVVRKNVNLYFISGQIGVRPGSSNAPNGITEQTRNVLLNLREILDSEDLSMDEVIKTTVFITDMNNFSAMNEEYVNHFPNAKPARSCIAVKELPRVGGDSPILVEIEAVASKGSK